MLNYHLSLSYLSFVVNNFSKFFSSIRGVLRSKGLGSSLTPQGYYKRNNWGDGGGVHQWWNFPRAQSLNVGFRLSRIDNKNIRKNTSYFHACLYPFNRETKFELKSFIKIQLHRSRGQKKKPFFQATDLGC